MNLRSWTAGLLAAALFVPTLTACKTDTDSSADGGSAAPAVPADPKQALLASTKELQKGNFTFTMAGADFTGDGKMHLPTKSAEIKMASPEAAADDMSMNLHMVVKDTDKWVKLEFSGAMADSVPAFKEMKGKYQHLDRNRIKGGGELGFDLSDVDPGDSDAMIKTISEIRKTGEGSYEGTLDVSKATGLDAIDAPTVKALGAKAAAVPFTAKLDPQGRLTEFAVQVPAAGDQPAQTVKVTYADYGTATEVQAPPAAQVVEASEQTYRMFNN
ncbi:hypothetical protein [Micromonospora mirobrigensis]|uniref:Lipoprotein n=1 Tax=Micromonospora mirobrigensis TaxID=262898 RepID=A0A1C4UQB1_9ACTN|nr:hypothetical protein [Micromonospora mirobrigensis]SCE73812.1 hypothetical protein GA0070564_101643 [Micromonospora mirobrigensis]